MSEHDPDRPRRQRRSPCVYTNRRGMEQREEILRALQFTVSELGWRATTMREIAKRAGLSVSTVHHHFSCRDEIARALYDDACADIDAYARWPSRAPFEVLFRDLVSLSLNVLAGLGDAYPEALAQSVRTGRALPTLWLSFDALLARATDVDQRHRSAVVWLVEETHRVLVESRLLRLKLDDDVLQSAEFAGRAIAQLTWTPAIAQLLAHADAASTANAQIAGTEFHRRDVRRMLTLGLPTRNPRRTKEALRRRPA